MKSRLLFSAFIAAVVALEIVGIAPAEAKDSRLVPGTFKIDVEAGFMTLEAHDASLFGVLRTLGERVGFETILVGELNAAVSASFTGVPVGDGLERLIRNVNQVVLYAPQQEGSNDLVVSQLWLFGPSSAAGSIVVGASEPPAPDDLEQTGDKMRADAVLQLANSYATREVLGRLSMVLRDDENAFVRSRAATGLGALKDERAVPALESALEDEHASVRTQAIHALGQIGGERATMALGDFLLYSEERNQRVQAAWALGRQNTVLAQSFLDAVANDPDEVVWMASQTPPGSTKGLSIEAPTNAEQRGSYTIK